MIPRLISSLVGLILLLFILGIAGGIYEGNELQYEGITINASDSTINQGIEKIVDGILTISYEIAEIVGSYAIKNNWNLNILINFIPKIFIGFIILGCLWIIIKIIIYGYVLLGEFKSQKRDKLQIRRLQEIKENE